MPYSPRIKQNSVVDMLSKVHVNRGSLLKSIENLLKTIESSESAVMIPTLLRDKCEFDAWELLFVAKILKASILGHSDLVEFYMNHMGTSLAAVTSSNNNNVTIAVHTNGISGSSSVNGLQTNSSGFNDTSSPIASPNGGLTQLPTSPSLSTSGSLSSATTTNSQNQHQQHQQQQQHQQSTESTKSPSSVSWMTANQQASSISSGSYTNSSASESQSSSSVSTSSSASSSSTNGSSNNNTSLLTSSGPLAEAIPEQEHAAPTNQESANQQEPASKPSIGPTLRQAQPPSLLQLTTTNNHINSVAAVAASFTNNNIEQLTHQLTALQVGSNTNGFSPLHSNGRLDGALSISTTVANQQSANGSVNGTPTGGSVTNGHHNHHHHELRSSRSAGCLFRINSSGASSPKTPAQTPTTPYPQAECLANGKLANGLLEADPAAPVKLLLQIEQLKSSITHVTNLLESVVELYKKSIDNLA